MRRSPYRGDLHCENYEVAVDPLGSDLTDEYELGTLLLDISVWEIVFQLKIIFDE